MTQEQPIEPTVEQPVTEEPTLSAESLLEELNKIGIENPEQIQNMHFASQQAGRTGQLLGTEREKVAALERKVAELQNQSTYNYEEPDIKTVVKESIRDFYQTEILGPQQKSTEQYYQDMAVIQSDPDFKLAGPVFEQWKQRPDVMRALQSGQTTFLNEYNKCAREALRKLALDSRNFITKQTPSQTAPHMESNSSASQPMPSDNDEVNEKVKNLRKPENWGGSESDLRKLVDTVLPQGSW